MKKLIIISAFLLFSSHLGSAQTYEFATIDKRRPTDWEIREISGTVVFTDSTITITMPNRIHVLTIISQHQFISQNDRIYECINEDSYQINLRARCEYLEDRKYVDLYYYSDIANNKYFRFYLIRI